MRQAAKRKDGDVKKRRERNRQAQHDFRQRRQAAEEAQRRRIQQLENTIEEMSNVFIGFCDEMIGAEETARQPKLMARLQRSTAHVLLLARSVVNADEDNTTREKGNERDDGKQKDGYQINQVDQKIANSNSSQASSCHGPPSTDNAFVESADAGVSSTSEVETWDLMNTELGSGLDSSKPFVGRYWPPTPPHGLTTNFFSLRLVEVTLSQACLYLSGDLYIRDEDLERAFGSSLRLHTREQLVADWRWLLGPGKNQMYQATGIDWDTTYATRPTSNWGLFGPFPRNANYEGNGTSTASEHSRDEDLRPEFLTAIGVQEQLESLGAKVLGSDTMELSISELGLRETNTASSYSTHSASQPTRTPRAAGSAALIVQLSTSLLAANLSYVARCLEKGPVYPRHEVARAVEASVILAREG
ncbi:hypothetical protein B0J13DRAFT_609600 [Dactylonectria estremocensis]|uniref:BZIP domain-containing protein n=1 Tax=Dactylonectria estremocensis TaxID=1079267 RepID=A0A9P9EFV9_9HYPO|nr:hypothetical protein B0J13DRAFT_609600 [Dactylonectria estremocensis]